MAESNDVQQNVQDLRHDLDVQAATQAGTQATQAATQAGAQATQAATQAGLATAIVAGFVGLVVGTLLGIAITQSNNHNH
jgi:F0F1-type ATP synthase assembly protein I